MCRTHFASGILGFLGGLLVEMLTGPWEVTVGATDDGEGGTMLQYTVIEPQ